MATRSRPLRQDDLYRAKYVVGGVLSPDGSTAVYVLSETLGRGDDERQSSSLWQVAVRGGRPRRLTGEAGDDSNPGFAADGRSVFFLSSRSEVQQLYRIRLDGGEARALTDLPQGVTAFDVSPDGRTVAFSALAAASKPPGPNDHVRITRSWFRFDGLGYLWPEVETVTAPVGRAGEVEGWVLKPAGAKPPYKTILYIHGGPHAAFGYSFNADFQELVGAGYALAYCNPRGSTGYGDAFSTAILGRWGKPEHQDFDAFLDRLVEAGIADPDRLGVTGVSGGGHLSAWLIGNSRRFKAAVPEQGVYNMFSMWGVSDAGTVLIGLEMGGDPHRIPDRYWALSPLAHAHKCRTPTLLIQGENDIRCPMQQAEEFYTALRHAGCDVELLRLQNCSHALQVTGPPPLRRYRMHAMHEWFDRYLA